MTVLYCSRRRVRRKVSGIEHHRHQRGLNQDRLRRRDDFRGGVLAARRGVYSAGSPLS